MTQIDRQAGTLIETLEVPLAKAAAFLSNALEEGVPLPDYADSVEVLLAAMENCGWTLTRTGTSQ